MKKFFLTLILTVITLSCFTFSGCKKENKLDEVRANLSNYSIDINFDDCNFDSNEYAFDSLTCRRFTTSEREI